MRLFDMWFDGHTNAFVYQVCIIDGNKERTDFNLIYTYTLAKDLPWMFAKFDLSLLKSEFFIVTTIEIMNFASHP
jgi:hypothetical protein